MYPESQRMSTVAKRRFVVVGQPVSVDEPDEAKAEPFIKLALVHGIRL